MRETRRPVWPRFTYFIRHLQPESACAPDLTGRLGQVRPEEGAVTAVAARAEAARDGAEWLALGGERTESGPQDELQGPGRHAGDQLHGRPRDLLPQRVYGGKIGLRAVLDHRVNVVRGSSVRWRSRDGEAAASQFRRHLGGQLGNRRPVQI